MTIMDSDDMQRLWSLVEDLTNQLQANRQLCESLQQQADQLRGQAIHSGTGFALRRFNIDLSKEKFESELEALNVHLVKENLALSHENKQQAVLLREYENTLETVMAKFRSFSHSTQQHTLQLTQHYESLLAQTTHNAAEQTLAAETAFSGTLSHLGELVRRAMQSLDGEVSDNSDQDQEQDGAPPRKTKRGWVQDPKWYGSGGYTGKATDPIALRADEALESCTEEERLRIENETLRELLGLKEKSDALISSDTSRIVADPLDSTDAFAPQPKPMSPVERHASLTVDEAAIAAEASGQPPLKTLQISSTTRPGKETLETKPLSPARVSPRIVPALDRKDQIIEEAILAEDESESDRERGRRATEAGPSLGAEIATFRNETSTSSAVDSLPLVFASDDTESAPSSIQELRAATMQSGQASPLHASVSDQPGIHASAVTDADEITPIEELALPTSAEPATGAEPNMLAEAAPPALISTGIEQADALASKTTVTSSSGIDVAETSAPADPTTISSPTLSSSESTSSEALAASSDDTSISLNSAAPVKADTKPTHVPMSTIGTAPPADTLDADFKPISKASTDDEPSETVVPAEAAKEDNVSALPPADDAQRSAETSSHEAVTSTTDKDHAPDTAEAAPTSKNAKAATAKDAPSTPNQINNQGKKDGAASPSKKGGRGHRGKGNRHSKSNSNAANKNAS